MSSNKKLKRNPTIVCYKDIQDLIVLKDWFYNFDGTNDNRYKAIQKVKALSSRGKLPHAIESTSLLTSILLTDPEENGDSKDSSILQLSYTMALIRFVNGLLDPFQQSNFAIPLHQLAKNLNLPSFFVELRHMGTHELLPNLNILRIASKQALNWLFDNYWANVDEVDDLDDLEDNDEDRIELIRVSLIIETTISNLKIYKKIRKQDLSQVIKFGNSSEVGIKYWRAINSLKPLVFNDSTTVSNVLLFRNFLIYNNDKLIARDTKKFKFNSLLIKLYKPLLDEFGPEFKTNLLLKMIHTLNSYSLDEVSPLDTKLDFYFKHKDEINQTKEWITHLIQDILITRNFTSTVYNVNSNLDLVDLILAEIQKLEAIHQPDFISAIESTIEKTPNNLQIKKDLFYKLSNLNKELKIKLFATPPSLDDLLKDSVEEPLSERSSKKQKTITIKPLYLFEKHSEWKPLPFGIS